MNLRETIENMSPENVARLGLGIIAYIKPEILEGEPAYIIHNADGQPIGADYDMETCRALCVQNNLVPHYIH